MPRPPASARPAGRADRAGRHRPARWTPSEDEWEAPDGEPHEPYDELDGGADQDTPPAGPDGHAPHGERHGERHDSWDDDLLEEAAEEPAEDEARVPLLSVPESLRSLDVRVGARAVRGLMLLTVVVALVLGGRWWWVQQRAGAVPVEQVAEQAPEHLAGLQPADGTTPVRAQEGTAGPAADDSDDVTAGAAGDTRTQDPAGQLSVVVHVVGEVRRPGIVELPVGARVADAVAAVGGLTEAADQASLNLARPLVDGEQVWVGAPGEEPPPRVLQGGGPAGVAAGGPAAGAAGGASGPGAAGPPALLDLNLATQADLEELPGVGPVTAGHILTWREQHGRFSSVEELMEVSGIGERTFAQLEPLVTVGGPP